MARQPTLFEFVSSLTMIIIYFFALVATVIFLLPLIIEMWWKDEIFNEDDK